MSDWHKFLNDPQKALKSLAEVMPDQIVDTVIAGKPFKGTAAAATHLVGQFLREHIPAEALESLPKGEYWLPQAVIQKGLSLSLPQSVTLQPILCEAEGLKPTVAIKKLGAAFDVSALLMLEEILIDSEKQQATILARELDLKGTNWLGWLVAPLVTFFLRRVYGDKLVQMAGGSEVQVRQDPTNPERFVVDLANLPQVRGLKEISLLGISLLDYVQVTGCRHAEGGCT